MGADRNRVDTGRRDVVVLGVGGMVIVSSTKAIERAETATSNRDAVNNASVITSTDSAVALSTVTVPPLPASGHRGPPHRMYRLRYGR